MKIGDRIKYRREELNLSQDELAKRLGYKSRSSINKIENDASGLPQHKIAAIAKALLTTPSYIMGWETEVEEKPVETAGLHARILTDNELMESIKEYYELSASSQKMVRDLIHNLKK